MLEVHYIDDDKPYTPHKLLKEIISKTKGEMKIFDLYYELKTLEKLQEVEHHAISNS